MEPKCAMTNCFNNVIPGKHLCVTCNIQVAKDNAASKRGWTSTEGVTIPQRNYPPYDPIPFNDGQKWGPCFSPTCGNVVTPAYMVCVECHWEGVSGTLADLTDFAPGAPPAITVEEQEQFNTDMKRTLDSFEDNAASKYCSTSSYITDAWSEDILPPICEYCMEAVFGPPTPVHPKCAMVWIQGYNAGRKEDDEQ